MRKFVSLALIIFSLFCSSCNEETIPQNNTWTTTTTEKAHELFPQYGEMVRNLLSERDISYEILNTSWEQDSTGNIWFDNNLYVDNTYELNYSLCYYTQTPKYSFYYINLKYQVADIEDIVLDDEYFNVLYQINMFSTSGVETFEGVDLYKNVFNEARIELLSQGTRALEQYHPNSIDWVHYEIYMYYDEATTCYVIELTFKDFLSDDNVEN